MATFDQLVKEAERKTKKRKKKAKKKIGKFDDLVADKRAKEILAAQKRRRILEARIRTRKQLKQERKLLKKAEFEERRPGLSEFGRKIKSGTKKTGRLLKSGGEAFAKRARDFDKGRNTVGDVFGNFGRFGQSRQTSRRLTRKFKDRGLF